MDTSWIRQCSIATAVVWLACAVSASADVAIVKLTPELARQPKVAEVVQVTIRAKADNDKLLEVGVTGPVATGITVRAYLTIEQGDGQTRLKVPIHVVERDDTQSRQRVRHWSCSVEIDRELAATATLYVQRDSGPVATSYHIRVADFAPSPKQPATTPVIGNECVRALQDGLCPYRPFARLQRHCT